MSSLQNGQGQSLPPKTPKVWIYDKDEEGVFHASCAKCGSGFEDTEPPIEGRKRYCPDCLGSRRRTSCSFCSNKVTIFFTPRPEQILLCSECGRKEQEVRVKLVMITKVKRKTIRTITCEGCGEEKTVPPNWSIDLRRPIYCPNCYSISRSGGPKEDVRCRQ